MKPLSIILCALAAPALAQQPVAPSVGPAGAPKSAKTQVLEAGAKILQGAAPMRGFDIYLVGFHPMKDAPELQMEAHHWCHQRNEDFAQCILFDGNTATANMNGVEYIISEKAYQLLPAAERKFWHPHNGEILSGQLVAPGLPDAAEKALMNTKMNSYGKTWHTWNTGHEGHTGDALPLGEAALAWSFSRDGEAMPSMVQKRDRVLGIDSAAKRRDRAGLRALARPQSGVDALKGKFARPTTPIPAVVEAAPGPAAGLPEQ
jgi:hypothetical protein